ncbi:MAG: 50S ribosomal protein L4 [archaeon]
MKANVLDLKGKVLKEIDVHDIFSKSYRSDLIKKAVISSQTNSYQPKSPKPYSNRDNTAVYIGVRKQNRMIVSINTGKARLPRLKNRQTLMAGRVAGLPWAVGGPKAHPPKISKILVKRINDKEKRLATLSAISATANKDLVLKRGGLLPESIRLPIIVDNSIEKLAKTSEVYDCITNLGLEANILKAKKNKTVRAGKGKIRARKYKKRKSILFVLDDTTNYKSFMNLEGVDVTSARLLSAQDLAPGTHAGRLTIFSESAIDKLNKRFLKV